MNSDVQVQEVKNTVQDNINISKTIEKLDNIRKFIYLFNEFGLPQIENEDKYIDYVVQHASNGLKVENWYKTSLIGNTNLDYWGAIKQNCNDLGVDVCRTNKHRFGWDFYTATREYINSQSDGTDKKSALKVWIDTLRDLDTVQARAELDKYLPIVEKPETEKQDSVTEKSVEIAEKPETVTEKPVKTAMSAAEVLGNIAGDQLVQKIQQTSKKPVETLFGVPLDEFKDEFGGRSSGNYYKQSLEREIAYDVVYNDQVLNVDCKISSYDEYTDGILWVFDQGRQEYVKTEYYIALANKMWSNNLSRKKKKDRQVILKQVEQIGKIAGRFKLRSVERK